MTMRRPAPIVDELRQRRYLVGLTQPDIARAVGRTYRTVSKWELGETRPARWQLDLYAKAVGATIVGDGAAMRLDAPPIEPEIDAVMVRRAVRGEAGWRDLNRDERLAAWQVLRRRLSPTLAGRHFALSGTTIRQLDAGRAPRPRKLTAA